MGVLVVLSVFVIVFVIAFLIAYVIAYALLHDTGGMCTDNPDLHGRVYVITGTTGGLGRVTAKRIASHGATVVMLNHNEQTGKQTAASITEETGNDQVYNIHCELMDLQSVKTASEEVLSRWPKIDVLLCNAGIIATAPGPTVQGFERHYGVNFLSHFVLVNNLLPALQKSSEARLVLMSSVGQWLTFGVDFDTLTYDDYIHKGLKVHWDNHFSAYCRSKVAMLMFAMECHLRYGSDKFVSVAAAPGVIMTGIWRNCFSVWIKFLETIARPLTKSVELGAQTEITCCIAPYGSLVPGAYYDHRHPSFIHPQAKNKAIRDKLWETAFNQSREYLLNPDLALPNKN